MLKIENNPAENKIGCLINVSPGVEKKFTIILLSSFSSKVCGLIYLSNSFFSYISNKL